MKTYTLFISGGHVTPAIALLDEIAARKDLEVVFVGRKHAMEGSRLLSFEYQLISQKGIRFLPIAAGRIQRRLTLFTIPSIFKIPIGFVQALWYCMRERPSLIVSFGGYIALPLAVAGWVCRIPVLTHEQTRAAGLANRIIARLALRVCVSFEDMLSEFPKGKAVYTGLPMRKELFAPSPHAPFVVNEEKYPLVYITGGGTGAVSLNALIFPLLATLLKTHTVVHQVGALSLPQAQRARASLPKALQARYIVESYISLPKLGWVFEHAVLVIGRSGANTVTELAALGKAAVLIPLPWSGGREQEKNAAWLSSQGGAVVADQKTLTAKTLERVLEDILGNLDVMQSKADAFAPHVLRDGAHRVSMEIEQILPHRS